MKTFLRVVTILGFAMMMYVAGWWVLIERGKLGEWLGQTPLLPPSAGWRQTTLVAGDDFFSPIAYLRSKWHVAWLRKVLVGRWEMDGGRDFVEIYGDGSCSFVLGKYEAESHGEVCGSGYYSEFQNSNDHLGLEVYCGVGQSVAALVYDIRRGDVVSYRPLYRVTSFQSPVPSSPERQSGQ